MLKIWRWLRRKCLIQVKNVCMYVSHRSQNMQIICINCANHAKMDKYESSECSLICKTLENLGSCNQFVPCILIIRSSCCAEENRTFGGSFVFSSFSWNLYDIIRRHSVCVCVCHHLAWIMQQCTRACSLWLAFLQQETTEPSKRAFMSIFIASV